jgi:HlyD family secretion protein
MDRPIARRSRTIRLLKRFGPAVLIAILAVIALTSAFGVLRPSVRRSDIRTAIVDRGPVEATITASGTVVPEYEHVITSPIRTSVTRILRTPGDTLRAGESVVELDVSEARLALEKLDDRIALKRVEREQAELELAGKVNRWRNEEEIKSLESVYLDHNAQRCRENIENGLYSRDDLRRAEKEANRAHIELRQIRESIKHAESSLAAELRKLDLELSILRKERDEAAHRLERATGTTDRAGVLTWVVSSEGAAVRQGDEIARVADLSAFRVEATISDVHGDRLSRGLPVTVRSGDTELRGRVANVLPMVENGAITMEITLDDKSHPVLRHNLRVEVYVVTASEQNALRVHRGQFLSVDGYPTVFAIRGDEAVKSRVRFGLKNYEYYQILEGLSEGDEVILSSMEDYQHAKEVKLR